MEFPPSWYLMCGLVSFICGILIGTNYLLSKILDELRKRTDSSPDKEKG